MFSESALNMNTKRVWQAVIESEESEKESIIGYIRNSKEAKIAWTELMSD
jgi:hypothetical protein